MLKSWPILSFLLESILIYFGTFWDLSQNRDEPNNNNLNKYYYDALGEFRLGHNNKIIRQRQRHKAYQSRRCHFVQTK